MMCYAIELFFDEQTDALIRNIWRDLHRSKFSSHMVDSATIPHMSLAAFKQLDVDEGIRRVAAFAATTNRIGLSLSSIGSFPTEEGVLFLTPVVTEQLLQLHRKLHHAFRDFRSDQWAYYLPGNWVPHTTLAVIQDVALLSAAFTQVKESYQVIQATVEAVAIVKHSPAKVISRFDLLPAT